MKISNRTISLFVILGAFLSLVCFPDGALTAFGQEEEFVPNSISPLSKRTSLLDVPISVYPLNKPGSIPRIQFQELYEIKIMFQDRTDGRAGFGMDDFVELTKSALTSGLALFRESGSQTGFNYSPESLNSDLPVNLREEPMVQVDEANRIVMITFRPQLGTSATDLGFYYDQFPDYYVVGQTSLNLMQGDRFEVSIPENGITVVSKNNPLLQYTMYPDRFPGAAFAQVNPAFAEPAIFEGDIVQIVNTVSEVDNSNRIDVSSEPFTILGFDIAGRGDQQYFLKEIRLNFYGVSLQALAPLLKSWTLRGFFMGDTPPFFFSPWFYNYPVSADDVPLTYADVDLFGNPVVMDDEMKAMVPITMPLDWYGMPNTTFMFGMDSLNSHITGYTGFGPRKAFADTGQLPRTVTQDIFKTFSANSEGGVFMYRELGGTPGQYDQGVDHLIKLDNAQFRIEPIAVSPEEIQLVTSPYRSLVDRLVPSVQGVETQGLIPFLLDDTSLSADLFGLPADMLPALAEEPRPPFGSLECYMDPDCYFFDSMINLERLFLGLTEGQLRYLSLSEANGKTNGEELFGPPGFQMVYGFTIVLPVSKDNAISDLLAPNTRSGQNVGPDLYIAVKTSENLRNLDSFIPFIQPKDIVVGTNVSGFTKGATTGVSALPSVSSIGLDRKNTKKTTPVIGRPRPRVRFQDLTQATDENLSNNNILYDRSKGSPAKPVIGIDIIDFGQNATLLENPAGITGLSLLDTFMTENTVLGSMIIEFLPSTSGIFDPVMFDPIALELGVDIINRIVSNHSVALYIDDDTPAGDFRDNDMDGLVDEEIYNLQDDDGDGLIDEDLGDGDPAGENGVFDIADDFLPYYYDNFGDAQAFGDGQFVFTPNDDAKYQEYFNLILPADTTLTYGGGTLLPLNESGTWFAELDYRVMNFAVYEKSRMQIYPPFKMFDPTPGPDYGMPRYNMGMYSMLDPKMSLTDLNFGRWDGYPYIPEDLFVEDPVSGEIQWMLQLTGDDGTIRIIQDPDGDPSRTFALSIANAMRIPNPNMGFVRVGNVPMVVAVADPDGQTTNAQDPQGEYMMDPPAYTQFGFWIDLGADVGEYLRGVGEAVSQAFEQAATAVAEFNTAVEEAEAAASGAEEPTEPEYPELPDPIELSITDPFDALNINAFLEGNNGVYSTNYTYQIQLPDENFGPLAGMDYFLVLRASADAQVGDTFRVRISQGRPSSLYRELDPQSGEQLQALQPGRGISYNSYIETEYLEAYPGYSNQQITTGPIVVRSSNVAPKIQFVSPGTGSNMASADFTFEITVTAEDPDNVATIQLFVDNNNLDYDGSFIPGATLMEQDGMTLTYTLDLREQIPNFDPTLSYYIYARIDDRVNAPVYIYSDGPITTAVSQDNTGGPSTGGGSTIVVKGDMPDYVDYIKLSNDGRVFSLGDAPRFTKPDNNGVVADIEVTPLFSGMIIVQTDGRYLGSGNVGIFQSRLQPNDELLFAADEIAFYANSTAGGAWIESPTTGQITLESVRDVEVDWINGAIYILDGDGDMLLLGKNAKRNLVPEGVGMDLYRDMELSPSGDAMYYLTGNGMFFTRGSASVGSWSDLIAEDKYRDMELVINNNAVAAVLIINDDGRVTMVGSDSEINSLLSQVVLPSDVEPGTVRQIKVFPGTPKSLAIMTGSGQVYVFGNKTRTLPTDSYLFADEPGLDDDKIVDLETTSVNLQSVIESVRSIMAGISSEDTSKIMPYVASNYKDRTGADASGLQKSLNAMFNFYEIKSFSESLMVNNAFTIMNNGDEVTANVVVDFVGWYPRIQSLDVEVEDPGSLIRSSGGETIYFINSQQLYVRELGDGRGWEFEFWKITRFGGDIENLIEGTLEDEDYNLLSKTLGNKLLTRYVPTSRGPENPIRINFTVNQTSLVNPTSLMVWYRQYALNTDAQPPILIYGDYPGYLASVNAPQFDTIRMKFKRQSDGNFKLIDMNMRQVLNINESAGLELTENDAEPPYTQLDGIEIEAPFGFNFMQRGVVPTIISGDADVNLQDAETFRAGSRLGAIMMLPDGTDIYSLDPQAFLKTINMQLVRNNPYDPNRDTQGGEPTGGYTASVVPGRAYFVIAADGKRFGFIQVPPAQTGTGQPGTGGVIITPEGQTYIDYRFEESWVLPAGF